MTEQSGAVEDQLPFPAKPPRPGKPHARRRLLQIGCLPLTFMLVGCLLLFVNLGVFSQAPSWVSNPDEYLLGERLAGSLGLLAGLQVIGTWLLGLVAAGTAVPAAAGQGGMLRQRLAILRRRAAIAAWAVFILRVIFLTALAVSAVLAYQHITDVRNSFQISRNPHVMEVVALVSILSTALVQWLIGPFLRLRYSMALGAWGASWTHFRNRRVWMALTARMGAGMCGSIALLWGSTLGILVVGVIRQPFIRSAPVNLWWELFRFLPEDSWEGIVLLLGLSVLIVVYMVGQIALPPLYLWLARRRLAGRPSADARRRFASFLSDDVENAPSAHD